MAPGREIAAAYIGLIPSAQGIKANLERELAGPARQAGQTAGRAIEDGVSQGAERGGRRAAASIGSLVGGAAVLAGLNRAREAASNLQQAVGGTAAVFGEAADEIDTFAESAADSIGLSERAARELTSQLGASLKGYGFAVDDAAAKTIELTNLGGDLAATFGGTTAEAVAALSSALRGEFDPLERYGVALRQSAIDAEAVALGLASSVSDVDAYARAQAALSLIMEQSADAQGAAAAEYDTAAAAAQRAAANTENAAADLGEAILPIYTRISEGVSTVADGFAALPEVAQNGILALAGIAALSGPISRTVDLLGNFGSAARGVSSSTGNLLNVLAGGGSGLLGVLGPVGAGVGLAGAAWYAYADSQREATSRVQTLTAALEDQNAPIADNITRAFSARLSPTVTEGLAAIGVSAEAAEEAITGSAVAARLLEADLKNAGYDEAGVAVLRLRQDFEQTTAAIINAAIASERFTAEEIIDAATQGGRYVSDLSGALADGAVSSDELLGAQVNLAPVLALLGPTGEDAAEGVATAGEALAGAVEPTTDFADAIKIANDGLAALFDISDSLPVIETRLRDALSGVADEAARLNEAGAGQQERLDAFLATIDGGTGNIEDYARALLEQGASADEAVFRTNLLVDELFATSEQFGVTTEDAAALRDQLNLDYPDVDVAVRAIGLAETTGQLVALNTALSGLVNAPGLEGLTVRDFAGIFDVIPRAQGGPMVAGQSYLFEGHPEILTMGPGMTSAQVTPLADIDVAPAPAPAGGDIHFHGPVLEAEWAAAAVRREQRRRELLGAGGWG